MREMAMSYSEEAATSGVTLRRVGGWAVDGLILGVILLAMHLSLWVLDFVTFGLTWFLAGGLWVVPIAYVFAFVASPAQATPGQAVAGLKVVRDDDLGRPTPAQALVYAIGFALTWAAGAVWLVAAFFTRRARCLHDMASGVAVLREEAIAGLAAPDLPAGWAVR